MTMMDRLSVHIAKPNHFDQVGNRSDQFQYHMYCERKIGVQT